jgi:HEAT repeat protein
MWLLFFAAGASVCLAAGFWLVLIAARAVRLAMDRRSRSSRNAAAQALTRFEDDRDVEALALALASVKPEALALTLGRRLSQLDAAVRTGVATAVDRTRLRSRMLAGFGSAPEGTRLLYCELFAELPGAGVVPILESALRDRSALVRMGAAMSLVRLGAAPEPLALLDSLGARACASSRLILLFELLLPGREADIAAIAADLSHPARSRISALRSLALAESALYPALLQTLARDASPAVAAEVARSLPTAGLEAPAAVLSGLLTHRSCQVRREAAGAAGAEGSGQLAMPLRRLLLDRNPTVASRAARALSERAGRDRLALIESVG